MDAMEVSRQRRLHDWRDHWLTESRRMAVRESKLLTFEVVTYLNGLGLLQWWYRTDREEGTAEVLDLWFEDGPRRFLREAEQDLLAILAGEYLVAPPQGTLRTPEWRSVKAFESLAKEADANLGATQKLVERIFYGKEGTLIEPEPDSFLARVDAFTESGFAAGLAASPVKGRDPEHTIRRPDEVRG